MGDRRLAKGERRMADGDRRSLFMARLLVARGLLSLARRSEEVGGGGWVNPSSEGRWEEKSPSTRSSPQGPGGLCIFLFPWSLLAHVSPQLRDEA